MKKYSKVKMKKILNIGEDCDVDNYMKEVKDLLFDYENYFLERKSRGKKKTN